MALRSAKSILMCLLLLLILAAVLFPCVDVAEAVLPDTYIQATADSVKVPNGEWWTAPQYLNIAAVKAVVDGWRTSLDSLKQDPIVVAVIDSGISPTNELFSGNYDENGVKTSEGGYDVLLRDGVGNIIGQNTVGNNSQNSVTTQAMLNDDADNKHGTHVSGIVALLIHMFDLEEYIKIMPIKAGAAKNGSASFTSSDMREGIEFALSHGADVVNMSIVVDDPNKDSAFEALVTDAYATKAVFVAAAGNKGVHGARYPAASDNVIGVMNYTHGNGVPKLSSSSNYGSQYYALCAPGSEILSAKGGEGVFQLSSGTSMAAPMVSFAAALATLKCRLTDDIHSPNDIKGLVEHSYSSTITYNNDQLPVLDLMRIAMGADDKYAQLRCEGELEQTVNDLSPVNFSFKVYPTSLQATGEIKWYVDGETRSEGGDKFTFTPAGVVGEHTVKAVWSDGDGLELEDEASLSVKSVILTVDTIKKVEFAFFDNGGSEVEPKYTLGDTFHIGVKNPEWYDPDQLRLVKWYVNGTFTKSMGASFDFKPEEYGDYTIQFEYGGQRSTAFTIQLVDNKPQNDKLIIYICIAFGAVVVVSGLIALIVALHRRRS